MKKDTIEKHIKLITDRAKNERMPVDIMEITLFGSYVKGKEKPNDVDILVTYKLEDNYLNAMRVYIRLVPIYLSDILVDFEYTMLTKKMLTRDVRGVDLHILPSFDSFVRTLKDGKTLLKEGFPCKVIWSKSWNTKDETTSFSNCIGHKPLKRDAENPMMPYINFISSCKDRRITSLKIDLDKMKIAGSMITLQNPKNQEMKSEDIEKIVDFIMGSKNDRTNDLV